MNVSKHHYYKYNVNYGAIICAYSLLEMKVPRGTFASCKTKVHGVGYIKDHLSTIKA